MSKKENTQNKTKNTCLIKNHILYLQLINILKNEKTRTIVNRKRLQKT